MTLNTNGALNKARMALGALGVRAFSWLSSRVTKAARGRSVKRSHWTGYRNMNMHTDNEKNQSQKAVFKYNKDAVRC